MNDWIRLLQSHNELLVITEEVDTYLEAAHIAYCEMKKQNPRALLFTNLHDKKKNISYKTPVLINAFGNFSRCELLFGAPFDDIAHKITELLRMKKPKTVRDKLSRLSELWQLRHVFPTSVKTGACQEVRYNPDTKLEEILPILTTWEDDGGAFITMGQVYTKSCDGSMRNVGMYRLQLYPDNTLGLHWQIHKDSNHFFHEYAKAGQKMPVAIAIGGDPLYTWCATAPMPKGFFELMLYGLIRKKQARMVRCLSVDLEVPADVDFVIEGYVDTTQMRNEGPFGDHTGYYTPVEPYPYLHITAITSKKNPTFYATVVGKPPIEDKYMGYATGKIFLPLIKTAVPDLLDYDMPENGVFHNLIIAKLDTLYPGHAKQAMHALWGAGQMSFVKHAVFLPLDAPVLENRQAVCEYIIEHFGVDRLLHSEGVLDALDHSSPEFAYGGKLGIDLTEPTKEKHTYKTADDGYLLERLQEKIPTITAVKSYFQTSNNPILCMLINRESKTSALSETIYDICHTHASIVALFDTENNDLSNPYMLLWRLLNNIDISRDLYKKESFIMVDATRKTRQDGYMREWPKDTVCNIEVLESLKKRKLLDYDEEFLRKWQIVAFGRD